MLVRTERLTKNYGGFKALSDLDLGVERGEIVGLLGPNGSGKSTTIRLLLGFLRPSAGWATVAGYDCWRQSVAVRRQVAYLPGELRLYENMTGRQFLRFLEGIRGERLTAECDRLAGRLDIDLDRPIAALSSGMKRKLALLQVLLPNVPLLILDEPTNTLDPTMRDELLEQLLGAKAGGKAVLFSSHVLAEVERVCDRVAILSRGRLVHLQNMDDLREARLARLRLAGETEPATCQLDAVPGVKLLARKDGELTLECRGDLRAMLQWVAAQRVEDFRLEPLGLGRIYQQFHAGGDGGTAGGEKP